jgi:hypothetical protein
MGVIGPYRFLMSQCGRSPPACRPRPPPCRSRSSALPVGADRRITGAVGNERPSGPSIGTPTVNGKFQVHRQLRRRHGVRGIKVVRTPVQAPRANAFAERWVRTVRRECLDHLLTVSRRQIESVVQDYICHYNRARPHRGLGLAVPRPSSDIRSVGTVLRRDVLGGIIHEYERAA